MIFLLLFPISPQYGAGQQCCYDSTGTQILTYDSTGGSTPDRGHDWGSPPFLKPPRIPGFSHWLYDVISFYYCCLWSDNCDFYMKRRPSSDCRTYRPSRAGKGYKISLFLIQCWLLEYLYMCIYELTMVRVQCPVKKFRGRFLLICHLQNLYMFFNCAAAEHLAHP